MFWLAFDTLHDPLIAYPLGLAVIVGLVAGLCAWPARRFRLVAVLLPYLLLVIAPIAAGMLLIGRSREISWPAREVWGALAIFFAIVSVPAPAASAAVQALKLKRRKHRAGA